MDASWFIRPEVTRLPLSEGQWLLVKQRLSAGEYRAHLKRSSQVGEDGFRRIDLLEHGLSLVLAYLVDWSLVAAPIKSASAGEVLAALDNLEPSRFAEIKTAIDAHEAAMEAEREREKNVTDGEKNAPAISPSPSAAAGVSSGSVN